MANQEKLLAAIERNGEAIASLHQAVLSIVPEIKKALEEAKTGEVSGDQISIAIAALDRNTDLLKHSTTELLLTLPKEEIHSEPATEEAVTIN